MNLHSYIASIQSGGPGSGCNPKVGTCGRPSKEQEHKECVEKGFKGEPARGTPERKDWNKERRLINKLAKTRVEKGGKFSSKVTQEMKKKGMVIDLKRSGVQYTSKKMRILEEKTVLPNKKGAVIFEPGHSQHIKDIHTPGASQSKPYTHTVYAPTGKNDRRSGTQRIDLDPSNKPHSEIGKFTLNTTMHIPEEKRRTFVYEVEKGTAPGIGTSLFVHHELLTPTRARVVIQEVERDLYSLIVKTRQWAFDTAKQARGYLSNRYGIDIKWRNKK